ncbi:MAG: bifunctional UDP-N-acetylglucosamine diphosphorylase/glucosamine-1-phosphate N-acetyltransferase GlmU [Halieaceae bacterium]|nr:bifunctional UDP-N-acetylglucosamine diphosphorylase/glucosamine-1-phosphate N-acetyltransferase GlmU [Halieaceae bacterium]
MKLDIVILAAGEGKRMHSALPKVLHRVGGVPLLQHVLDSANALAPVACHVVVGHGSEQVRESFAQRQLNWVLQDQQLGTGHAVMQALPAIDDDAAVLVLYGDVPLIRPDTLKDLLAQAMSGPALLTARVNDPHGYGRILRTKKGKLLGVVEERDAAPKERLINEINTGILAAPAYHLKQLLPQVGNNNTQGEYYLPDIVGLALREGIPVATATAPSEIEVLGVNDRVQLNRVEREYQRRLAARLLQAGVGVADDSRLDIRGSLECGRDVSIDVNCVFEGENTLADGVKVGANCVLIDCSIGAGTEIKPFTHMEGVATAANCVIGPFARLRPETHLAEAVRIGNFVETKKSEIGAGSKVNHLSYIGDTDMGERVNIGAGTITCNYDGANKHRTQIGNGVFVGSNSTLVAPVEIEERGFVGAGSTITKTVPGNQLAISRARQRNLDGWKRPEKTSVDQAEGSPVGDPSESDA